MSAPAGSITLDADTRDRGTAPVDDSATVSGVQSAVTQPHGANSTVPVQTRSERFSSFDASAFPAVTGREPEWKFSPVGELRPLIDGELDGSQWTYESAPVTGATLEWVDRTDARIGSAGIPEDRASANAWGSFEKALAVTISGEEPVELSIGRSALDAAPRSAHTVITAGRHSTGHVLLQNTGSAQLVENVEIVLEDGANLTVVSVQQWDDDAVHLASHFVTVGRDATFRHVVISLDGKIVRINPSTHLVADGGDVELYGAYFASAAQHIEQQVFVDHVAPNTKSRVTYKGALQGQGAHTVWIGDVLIQRTAVGTDSYEQNRNLMLTGGARADSIPNLEIETGDILGAGHASASGRFDDEQLFYLESRGLTAEESRRLVVRGFLTEVVQKIGSADLEARLQRAIEAALAPVGADSVSPSQGEGA